MEAVTVLKDKGVYASDGCTSALLCPHLCAQAGSPGQQKNMPTEAITASIDHVQGPWSSRISPANDYSSLP